MRNGVVRLANLLVVILSAGLGLPTPVGAALPTITPEELLAKVAERAKQQKALPPKQEFLRQKTTVELDKHDRVKKREDLTYQMVIVDGKLHPRLIRRNGRLLNADDQAKEEKAAFKDRREPKSREGNTVLLRVTEQAAKRFNYSIAGQEQVNGRNAYVVTVLPKPELPALTMEEQVMAQITGRLWIDTAEYEVAKLELRLKNPVQFGVVGVLGALHRFDLTLRRNREAEGTWENSLVKLWLNFRVLLDSKRFQYEERVLPLPADR